MKKSITLFLLLTSMITFTGCAANLANYNTTPFISISKVHKDISDRTSPKVSFNYCIINPLDAEVKLNRAVFYLDVNNIPLQKKTIKINSSIPELAKSCHDFSFTTNALKSPKVASLLLESFFIKDYKITSELYFEDEDIKPTTNTFTGKLYN